MGIDRTPHLDSTQKAVIMIEIYGALSDAQIKEFDDDLQTLLDRFDPGADGEGRQRKAKRLVSFVTGLPESRS